MSVNSERSNWHGDVVDGVAMHLHRGGSPLEPSGAGLVVVLDKDDTCIDTQFLYQIAYDAAVSAASRHGIDGDAYLARVKRIDLDRARSMRMDASRFPGSLVEAMRDIHPDGPRSARANDLAQRLWVIGEMVFDMHGDPSPFLVDFLDRMSVLKIPVVVLTAGDVRVQLRRMTQLDEAMGFSDKVSEVVIVEEKTADVYSAVLTRLSVDPARTVMIGNSPRSDAAPALACGACAILVGKPAWKYDEHALDGLDTSRLWAGSGNDDVLTLADVERGLRHLYLLGRP